MFAQVKEAMFETPAVLFMTMLGILTICSWMPLFIGLARLVTHKDGNKRGWLLVAGRFKTYWLEPRTRTTTIGHPPYRSNEVVVTRPSRLRVILNWIKPDYYFDPHLCLALFFLNGLMYCGTGAVLELFFRQRHSWMYDGWQICVLLILCFDFAVVKIDNRIHLWHHSI